MGGKLGHLLRSRTNLWLWMFLAIFSFLLIPIWFVFIANPLKRIPSNFTYNADILSLDNFYDESLKKFEGPHISKTVFSYKVVASNPDFLTIKNVFTVHKQSGAPIFAVERLYYIDPNTNAHVKNPNDLLNVRTGYLFAPRYAYKDSFEYWHVNYNAAAKLVFVNEEKIDGLTVYHYTAAYTADQTDNVKQLPGVPDKRGVRTNIVLQLWIEPVSGWLVKYQDNSFASFYDRATGKIISPWNVFSNRYTQNSIRTQVENAYKLKWTILTVDFVVPGFLVFLAVCFVWIAYKKVLHPNYSILPDKLSVTLEEYVFPNVVWILVLTAIVATVYNVTAYQKPNQQFTIGISEWSDNRSLMDAIRGFKDRLKEYGYIEGKNLRFITRSPESDIEKQINIIQDFIDKKVNIIVTLTTPGTQVAKGITTDTPIVFTSVAYPAESNIVESDNATGNNLIGSRNYMAPPWQFYMFERLYPNIKVLGFVRHKGESDSDNLYQEFNAMLSRRGITVLDLSAIDLTDLQKLLQNNRYDALYLACDTLMQSGGGEVVAKYAIAHKIPTLSCDKDSVLNGALMGYIADQYTVGRLAGRKAALILRGAEPNWLRVESPVHGYLIINLDTAKLLGITIPSELLQRANELVRQEKHDH